MTPFAYLALLSYFSPITRVTVYYRNVGKNKTVKKKGIIFGITWINMIISIRQILRSRIVSWMIYIFKVLFGYILQRLTRLLSQFQPINIPILHSIASISHYNFVKFHTLTENCVSQTSLYLWDWTFHVLSCLHGFLPLYFISEFI